MLEEAKEPLVQKPFIRSHFKIDFCCNRSQKQRGGNFVIKKDI